MFLIGEEKLDLSVEEDILFLSQNWGHNLFGLTKTSMVL